MLDAPSSAAASASGRPGFWARMAAWFGKGPRPAAAVDAAASTQLSESPADSEGPHTRGLMAHGAHTHPPRELPRLSDYTLQQVVARNDRRTVYRALEDATGRVVALKTVTLVPGTSPQDRRRWRDRFLREAEAASRLRHPDIVRVRAGGVQGHGDATLGWLALEWVPGADLSRYTSPSRLLPERLVFTIVGRVAMALGHAHESGIVHRDIKPGNVMFDPGSGGVKVTDFGSARVADSETTGSGMIVGTPAYMSPEQLAGADATAQSDLYSLGVMLHELLTGHRPFEAPSMGELLSAIARQPPPKVTARRPDLPPLVDDIVARLLAKQPDARHRDGRQLARELQVAQATLPQLPAGVVLPGEEGNAADADADADVDAEDLWSDPFAPTLPPEDDTAAGAGAEAQSTLSSSGPAWPPSPSA